MMSGWRATSNCFPATVSAFAASTTVRCACWSCSAENRASSASASRRLLLLVTTCWFHAFAGFTPLPPHRRPFLVLRLRRLHTGASRAPLRHRQVDPHRELLPAQRALIRLAEL